MSIDQFEPLIETSSLHYGVPASLIRAVITHESGGDPNAVGDGGRALGLMQMHAEAATEVGAIWATLKDPVKAIDAGTHYLAIQLKRFGGDQRLALMAYNQGPTVIRRAQAYADAVFALMPPDPTKT